MLSSSELYQHGNQRRALHLQAQITHVKTHGGTACCALRHKTDHLRNRRSCDKGKRTPYAVLKGSKRRIFPSSAFTPSSAFINLARNCAGVRSQSHQPARTQTVLQNEISTTWLQTGRSFLTRYGFSSRLVQSAALYPSRLAEEDLGPPCHPGPAAWSPPPPLQL